MDKQENIAAEELASLNQIKTSAKMEHDQSRTRWDLIQSYLQQKKNLWELPFISSTEVATLIRQISEIRITLSAKSKRWENT